MLVATEIAVGAFGCIAGAGAAAQFTVDRDWRYIVMATMLAGVGIALIADAALARS